MRREQSCQINLGKPGTFMVLPVDDQYMAGASVFLISTGGAGYDSGTLVIEGSLDGYEYADTLATLTSDSAETFDVRAYSYVRARVGTAASSSVVVHVTLTATQTG